jgi:hypothetical protein
MTKKIETILSAKIMGLTYDRLHVKVDGQGFPYVIIENQKIIIAATEFPRQFFMNFGEDKGTLYCESGLSALAEVLRDPALTVDKLSPGSLARMA